MSVRSAVLSVAILVAGFSAMPAGQVPVPAPARQVAAPGAARRRRRRRDRACGR